MFSPSKSTSLLQGTSWNLKMIVSKKSKKCRQFLQTKKNQLTDLLNHLERYCNILPVFCFNRANCDINSEKSYLLPFLLNERGFEPLVIKNANQFVSFKFGDVQLRDILNLIGGAASFDSFIKAYKTSEAKSGSPYEWFSDPKNLNITQHHPYHTFFSKLRKHNPQEKDYSDFKCLKDGCLASEEAFLKLKLKQPFATGQENYQYLTSVRQQEKMCTFKDFCAGITTRTLFLH